MMYICQTIKQELFTIKTIYYEQVIQHIGSIAN